MGGIRAVVSIPSGANHTRCTDYQVYCLGIHGG
ncbi:unnamed protein product [Nippostrongylus brasiliensis]|uniref:Uncharacterized protein n=1 Tax=Nippostrongylus brasiliensis TaxID=27835 RepID=A0A0N4YGY0_NIPBR|nr:unnamed protein product [Nippostrongylus brasiliensis]